MSKIDYYYAVPEHLVIRELLPGIEQRRVDAAEAQEIIAKTPGLVPVAIDPAEDGNGRPAVYWADIGQHPFREWQFLYTIAHLAETGEIGASFATDMDVLQDPAILDRGIAPRGFIFHVSRCGSTLLAKALARSDANIVINQGGPLQHGFWSLVTDGWRNPPDPTPENLSLFRQLVLAMTRRRHPDQTNAFVKFISWNTLCVDFISRAFPDVPQLFLYRDAAEVIASVRKNTTAALEARGTAKGSLIAGPVQDTDDVKYLTKCYNNYFRYALDAVPQGLKVLNYRDISGDNALQIMEQGLAYTPPEAEWDRMRKQFSLYSKDDSGQQKFTSDEAEKQNAITDAEKKIIDESCRTLVEKLDHCPGNLFPESLTRVSKGL